MGTQHHCRRALSALILAAAVATAGCGSNSTKATPPTTSRPTTTTTAPTYPPITTGSFASAGRLSCISGIKTFDVTGAPIGSTLPTFSSPDAAVAATIRNTPHAVTAAVVGPEQLGTRYVIYDQEHVAIEEVVVGTPADGTRVVEISDCE